LTPDRTDASFELTRLRRLEFRSRPAVNRREPEENRFRDRFIWLKKGLIWLKKCHHDKMTGVTNMQTDTPITRL
jgi:hypothetical protein